MIKVMSVFGTRPEAIKMCPLVKKIEECQEMQSVVCLTGQHKEMLQQVIDIFKINVHYNLNIMRERQTLSTITTDILIGMEEILKKEKPDLVLVHGDTTTSFAAALAAFYQKIPVGHVEAGLRTYDKYSPFPEEMNRNLTGKIADLHFAPTKNNLFNLNKEGIKENILVTGNTVIDALQTTVVDGYIYKSVELRNIDFANRRSILVTAHRRENLGEPLEKICDAIIELVEKYQDVIVVYPVHLNPQVRDVVYSKLSNNSRIFLVEPVDVEDMHNLMSRSYLVLTDSGGLQEEAPAFGVPVLVLRNETERGEAVEAGTVKLVGTDTCKIVKAASELLEDKDLYIQMSKAINPYGDGYASERIVEKIQKWFEEGEN